MCDKVWSYYREEDGGTDLTPSIEELMKIW